MHEHRPFTLVLSGGGMKGLAHVGVLRALAERGLEPALVVGSSMGSLVAAAWAAGMPLDEMEDRARAVTRRDVFQVAHVDMALRRMRSPAVYRADPLDALIRGVVGTRSFRALQRRLLVNTVDIVHGVQVLWGLPGLDDVPVAEAVFASCALPGIFPPRPVGGRLCVDGAVAENLPLRMAAAAGEGPVVAVTLLATHRPRVGVESEGFAATYIRGLELVMQGQVTAALRQWSAPPLLLVQPQVADTSMFAFDRTEALIAEGYRATAEALDRLPAGLHGMGLGVHPRRPVDLRVDAARCIGCGTCTLWAPHLFRRGPAGRAEVLAPRQQFSAVDDMLIQACPAEAIHLAPADPRESAA